MTVSKLDESVLYRPVVPAAAMHAQLMHLADLATWPNISIQIVPYGAGGHIGLVGAFVVAEAQDMTYTVLLDNAADGQTAEDGELVAQVRANFEVLRDEAPTVTASRELIMKVAEELCQTQQD